MCNPLGPFVNFIGRAPQNSQTLETMVAIPVIGVIIQLVKEDCIWKGCEIRSNDDFGTYKEFDQYAQTVLNVCCFSARSVSKGGWSDLAMIVVAIAISNFFPSFGVFGLVIISFGILDLLARRIIHCIDLDIKKDLVSKAQKTGYAKGDLYDVLKQSSWPLTGPASYF